MKISGIVWKFGDDVDTDQIIPAEYLITADRKELAKHSFEKVRPEFAKKVREGDIIVAEKNFGCGSSREHAPSCLLGNGIKVVIAKSFARIFYRNSINLGLRLIECEIEAKDNDIVEIDFDTGEIKNLNSSKIYEFKKMPKFFEDLTDIGLIEYTKRKISEREMKVKNEG
ncbi:MAG: 3-isopropylmalate dehydratase [Candidatus Altiarchaeales archaeon A3]|nr:MAG: 3-isopropylmalate dehydratase [Candidatus Altiarchaeales archaeon A3]